MYGIMLSQFETQGKASSMKQLAVLTILLALGSAFDFPPRWEEWKKEHGKAYSSELEELRRHITWLSNMNYVRLHNQHAQTLGFILEMNVFGDLESSEFSSIYNGLCPELKDRARKVSAFNRKDNATLPVAVDWRDTPGVVTYVKNQGQCGSCWAFSTTGSLEGQTAIRKGLSVVLSEQQLVDCSSSYGNNGCEGGLMDNAFLYIRDNGGDDTEDSYPYEAHDDVCRFDPNNVGATDSGYVNVQSGSEGALQEAVATVGPISVAIDASHSSFQFYSSGIYNEPSCSQTALDHGVLVVGYGTSSSDFWIVKNSWGASWGEAGYIQMIRNDNNQCGIATMASYPTV